MYVLCVFNAFSPKSDSVGIISITVKEENANFSQKLSVVFVISATCSLKIYFVRVLFRTHCGPCSMNRLWRGRT